MTKQQIKIPYAKSELTLALITATNKLENNEDEVKEKLEHLEVSEENKMKTVADHIGITINELINSPNMDKLINQYDTYRINQIVNTLKDFGLSDKEAWAVFIYLTQPQLLDLEH